MDIDKNIQTNIYSFLFINTSANLTLIADMLFRGANVISEII